MSLKKIVFINLIASLVAFTTALDGFDSKFNKFVNYYFIDQTIDWGDLYQEGGDIDFKAAILAQKDLKGGRFDDKSHSIIPNDIFKTEREWRKAKNQIVQLMGPIPQLYSKESTNWQNSSKNWDDLLRDAHQVAPTFKHDFQNIAKRTGTIVHFGLDDQNIIKTEESLRDKINRDVETLGVSREEATVKIGDSLRGTLIVEDVSRMSVVIAELMRYSDEKGAKIAFKNVWAEDRKSGYVGIHAKILYPVSNLKGEEKPRYMITEMQIHLASMVDGTELSAKERAHLIYENVRSNNKDHSHELSAASKLLFLTAMEETLAANLHQMN